MENIPPRTPRHTAQQQKHNQPNNQTTKGGVGSTELSNFLTRRGVRCNLLTDADAVRHVNRCVARMDGCGAGSGRKRQTPLWACINIALVSRTFVLLKITRPSPLHHKQTQ
jgi:hypothetical protein